MLKYFSRRAKRRNLVVNDLVRIGPRCLPFDPEVDATYKVLAVSEERIDVRDINTGIEDWALPSVCHLLD